MSFGGGGGFGGFGQQNNNQSSTFGGFGSNNNNTTTSAFGSANTGGAFGQSNNTGGGLFGGSNTNNTGGGFGASSGGSGLFGGNNNTASNTSTFGGFGNTNNTANTTSSFGSGATGGGLFGSSANKTTGFGSTGNTGGSLFGGGNTNTTTSTGFGGGGFGAPNNPGLGQTGGDPPGTAATPFQAFTEKEGTSNQTNSFQNILLQEPYRKWSGEELRLADYMQGRRHGNGTTGGGGAFGVSSGFGGGGFGATNNNTNTTGGGLFGSNNNNQQQQQSGGGLFGSNNTNTTSAFGQSTTAGGFGQTNTNTNTGGGLFGSKPAGGGLFGSGNTTQSTGFGSGTTGGFGQTNTNNNQSTGFGTGNTGGGLFGSNNNSQQKPAGGLFGSSTTTNTTGGFGANNTNNAFGANNNTATNTGGGLFGNNNNQQQSGGGLFGSANNNNSQQQQAGGTGFGGFGQNNQNQNQQQSGGLFGNNQQKPAGGGLFGSSTAGNNNTGGGLFGQNNNNQQQQQTSAFGQNNSNQQQGGGLFGSKPATGGGLFGASTNQQTNTGGGGLFGNANNQSQQQSTGGGLFGNAMNNNQQQQKPGGLFGSSTQNTGGGLFGGQNNQNQGGGGLFGNSTNNQPNQGMGNSLLGNSQQSNNAPQGLTANLNDVSAYGSPSLFASGGNDQSASLGPLATPVGGSAKPKRASILPMYKLAPSSASRFATPQKRGFGFSYSTYGTPGSASSSIASTPGTARGSLLGSSSSGALSKSVSTNNLRRNFNTEDSILAPGAFSASSGGPRWYGSTGSKKLVISRDMRSDLFSTPQKDKQAQDVDSSRKISKKVSFTADTDASTNEEQPEIRGALPAPDGSPSTAADDTPRQNRVANGNDASGTPEAIQAHGDVRDESNVPTPGRSSGGATDLAPGEYWCKPSMEELEKMNRVQRQSIDGLVVGRHNVGSVAFLKTADISGLDPKQLFGEIVQLSPRSATVYPDGSRKPPVGHGINLPSRITLEQSWPRGGRHANARKIQRHEARLREMDGTKYINYDPETGVWIFEVEHFTTYGLDDSEDDDEDTEMDVPFDTTMTQSQQLAFNASTGSGAQDDTFQFRRSRTLPGAFDEPEEMIQDEPTHPESFLGVSSADSAPNDVRLSLDDHEDIAEPLGEEYDSSDDEDLTRSDVGQHLAAEQDDFSSEEESELEVPKGTPGGILRARMRALKESAGPMQVEVADGDDWAEMLRKTVSPAKRDRRMLKELQETSPSRQNGRLVDFDNNEGMDMRKSSIWRKSRAHKEDALGIHTAGIDKGRGFATSIDLMNSLFEKPKPASQNLRASTTAAKGFPQFPYERQDKNLTVDESTKAYHDGSRPTWGPNETLVVTQSLGSPRRSLRDKNNNDLLAFAKSNIQSSRQAVRLGKFSTESSEKFLRAQEALTEFDGSGDVPQAKLRANSIKDLFHNLNMNDPASVHEKRVWELASILFDGKTESANASRKANLSAFWAELVEQSSTRAIGLARTSEEKAVACLAGHRITEACKYLLEGKNVRLATLVPLIGTSESAKKDMREQLKTWRENKAISEFSEPIRAIYELLSGNASVCEGMKGVPLEHRLESFVISKFFGLDWRQAFGLRLWYAISHQEDITAAVEQFEEDIFQNREDLPRPWYQDEKIQPLWDDYEAHNRQDLLWGLLQTYALEDVDVEAILRPENSQLSPLEMRLSWQLGVALRNFTVLSKREISHEKADATTVSYAAQLTAGGEWLEAVFVLLHLTDPVARQKAIQDHLCRHAGLIGGEADVNFTTLTERYLIPAKWVWEALALYQRGVKKNAPYEVHCLVKAGAYEEAHRVLIQQVAPQAIIERDYATLESLMEQFDDHSPSIGDWLQGGELYNLFLSLLEHRAKGEVAPREILDRLLAGLQNEQVAEGEIVRYAALSDMADETAKEIVKLTRNQQDVNFRSRILKLPLTQDRLLAYSVDLGMERYRSIVSH